MPKKHLQLIDTVSLGKLNIKKYDRFPVPASGLSVNRLLKVLKLTFGAGKAQAII